MAWGLEIPSNFGPCRPEGVFVGYLEKQLEKFNAMSLEEKARFDGRYAVYKSFIFEKFNFEVGAKAGTKIPVEPLEDNDWPTEFQSKNAYTTLCSWANAEGIFLVEAALKGIIEELEPDVHQFRSVRAINCDGEPFGKQYFLMVVGRYLTSFSPEDSDPESYFKTGGSYVARSYSSKVSGLAIKRSAFGAAHLWKERFGPGVLSRPQVLFSDQLQAKMKKEKMRLPKHYRLKEV